MSGDEGWIQPLECQDTGPRVVLYRLPDRCESRPRMGDEVPCPIRHIGDTPKGQHVLQNVIDRVRVDRQHPGVEVTGAYRFLHIVRGHRAHVTDRLGQNEIGLQVGKQVAIDGVDAAVAFHRLADRPIDRAAVQTRRVEAGAAHPRSIEHRRREIAFVRDPDQALL